MICAHAVLIGVTRWPLQDTAQISPSACQRRTCPSSWRGSRAGGRRFLVARPTSPIRHKTPALSAGNAGRYSEDAFQEALGDLADGLAGTLSSSHAYDVSRTYATGSALRPSKICGADVYVGLVVLSRPPPHFSIGRYWFWRRACRRPKEISGNPCFDENLAGQIGQSFAQLV